MVIHEVPNLGSEFVHVGSSDHVGSIFWRSILVESCKVFGPVSDEVSHDIFGGENKGWNGDGVSLPLGCLNEGCMVGFLAVWVADCDDDVDPICDRIQLAAFA